MSKKTKTAIILLFCFALLIVFLALCQSNNKKVIPFGFENTSIRFNMTIEEMCVLFEMEYNEFWDDDTGHSCFTGDVQNIFEHDAYISYLFNGSSDNIKSRLIEIDLWLSFQNDDECTIAIQEIINSIENAYKSNKWFSLSEREGQTKFRDAKDLIAEYTVSTDRQYAVVQHYPNRIFVQLRLPDVNKRWFSSFYNREWYWIFQDTQDAGTV